MIGPTADVLTETQASHNYFAGFRDPKAEHDEADTCVIAIARLRGGTSVTQETTAADQRNPKRTHYIPDVCHELGISCIGLLETVRREGWTFRRHEPFRCRSDVLQRAPRRRVVVPRLR